MTDVSSIAVAGAVTNPFANVSTPFTDPTPPATRPFYSCSLCSRTFPNASNRRRHMRSLHSQVRPFVCRRCGMCFSDSSNCRKHESIRCALQPRQRRGIGPGFSHHDSPSLATQQQQSPSTGGAGQNVPTQHYLTARSGSSSLAPVSTNLTTMMDWPSFHHAALTGMHANQFNQVFQYPLVTASGTSTGRDGPLQRTQSTPPASAPPQTEPPVPRSVRPQPESALSMLAELAASMSGPAIMPQQLASQPVGSVAQGPGHGPATSAGAVSVWPPQWIAASSGSSPPASYVSYLQGHIAPGGSLPPGMPPPDHWHQPPWIPRGGLGPAAPPFWAWQCQWPPLSWLPQANGPASGRSQASPCPSLPADVPDLIDMRSAPLVSEPVLAPQVTPGSQLPHARNESWRHGPWAPVSQPAVTESPPHSVAASCTAAAKQHDDYDQESSSLASVDPQHPVDTGLEIDLSSSRSSATCSGMYRPSDPLHIA